MLNLGISKRAIGVQARIRAISMGTRGGKREEDRNIHLISDLYEYLKKPWDGLRRNRRRLAVIGRGEKKKRGKRKRGGDRAYNCCPRFRDGKRAFAPCRIVADFGTIVKGGKGGGKRGKRGRERKGFYPTPKTGLYHRSDRKSANARP